MEDDQQRSHNNLSLCLSLFLSLAIIIRKFHNI